MRRLGSEHTEQRPLPVRHDTMMALEFAQGKRVSTPAAGARSFGEYCGELLFEVERRYGFDAKSSGGRR